MRLWTLHPKYLDARGLVALWREGLLAQAVLQGMTKGYVNHPQLARFRNRPSAVGAIAEYLRAVHEESLAREYSFAADKIGPAQEKGLIDATRGQVEFEWQHLMEKLRVRERKLFARFSRTRHPEVHPLFRIVPGGVEHWEKAADAVSPRRRRDS